MPIKKPKESTTLAKAAKTYKKNHKISQPKWNGASFVDSDLNKKGLGATKSKLTYKPKPMSATFGTDRKNKPGTITKSKNRL